MFVSVGAIIWGASRGCAEPLKTLQNSNLSVPAAKLAAGGLAGATNLTAKLLLSGVNQVSAQGGHVTLRTEQAWVRRFDPYFLGGDSSGYGIVLRPTGGVVITGPTQKSGAHSDFVTIAYDPDGAALWTNRYDGSGHGDDTARFIATNPSGDVWVLGDSRRNPTNWAANDVALIRYSSTGLPLWTNRFTEFETNGTYPSDLGVTDLDDAYVVSSSVHWEADYTGSAVETSLTKFDSAGNALWTRHYFDADSYVEAGIHTLFGVAASGGGFIYLAGQCGGANYDTGLAIVKEAGDLPLWTNSHPNAVAALMRSMQVDSKGAVILTGETYRNGSLHYVVLKCSAEGESSWTNYVRGPGYDGGNVPRTVLDPTGNVCLIGGTPGQAPGLYQIVKFSPGGIPLWTNQHADFGITNSMIDQATADNAGNLYLLGHAPGPGGFSDFVLIKFSPDGAALWTNRVDGGSGRIDWPYGMVVEADGSVYLTGRSGRSYSFGELFVVKFSDRMVYSPPKDFVGTDVITYTVTDDHGNSATGSMLVEVSPGAFRFEFVPQPLNSAGVRLQLSGAPGTNAIILEASTDLVRWEAIQTNQPINGTVEFGDSQASGLLHRYYQAHQQQ